MSEARILKLEDSVNSMQMSFAKLETTLENIDKNLERFLETKEEIVTFREKHKVTEGRLINLEDGQAKNTEAINSVNLKIAVAT